MERRWKKIRIDRIAKDYRRKKGRKEIRMQKD